MILRQLLVMYKYRKEYGDAIGKMASWGFAMANPTSSSKVWVGFEEER